MIDVYHDDNHIAIIESDDGMVITMKIPRYIDIGKRFKIVYENTFFIGTVIDILDNPFYIKKSHATKHCFDVDTTRNE
jgi:hypothetical protein